MNLPGLRCDTCSESMPNADWRESVRVALADYREKHPWPSVVSDDESRCSCHVSEIARLRRALQNLVTANEEWNAAVQAIIGRPPKWNDDYLREAREALRERLG